MPHKFSFARKEKLISEKRKETLPAKETLLALGLRAGDKLIDVGCGPGYFSFPAGEIVGPDGWVLGLDIQAEFVDYCRQKLTDDAANVRFEISGENELPCEDGAADAILLSVVLHEVDSKKLFLAEMKRALADNGRLMIIEWLPVEMESGPPKHERIAPDELRVLLEKHDFAPGESIDLSHTHYGMTATLK